VTDIEILEAMIADYEARVLALKAAVAYLRQAKAALQ